ncbi:hypothetical protein KY285_005371 [Solanum tuberosum]|nr:hypothetical protein KY285_005371 [Solanum tuberosum]
MNERGDGDTSDDSLTFWYERGERERIERSEWEEHARGCWTSGRLVRWTGFVLVAVLIWRVAGRRRRKMYWGRSEMGWEYDGPRGLDLMVAIWTKLWSI